MSENISIEINSNENYTLDGVIGERINNYNEFVLSKRKMWRIPENDLKMYIIKNKLLTHECKVCKLKPEWRKKPLELVLDRINNEVLDNDLDNLRFLCPNCYSQLKKKSSIFEKNISAKMVKCEKCGKRIKYKTFSVNKQTSVEHFCKPCLEQERIEMRLNSRKQFPKEI
tara:strand:+ start:558 stop:1067 length:510 start_codon:yes stop_codon:yes gene_type:complete